MNFERTPIDGVWMLRPVRAADERGFFARTWCREEFVARGLCSGFVQASLSYNHIAGTLRGLHWQRAPHEEAKLVRCSRGHIFDVVVDLRPGSPNRVVIAPYARGCCSFA